MPQLAQPASPYDSVAGITPDDSWDGISTPTSFKNVAFSGETVFNAPTLLLSLEDEPRNPDYDNSLSWAVTTILNSSDAYWDDTNKKLILGEGVFEVTVAGTARSVDAYGYAETWPEGHAELALKCFHYGLPAWPVNPAAPTFSVRTVNRYTPAFDGYFGPQNSMSMTQKFYFSSVLPNSGVSLALLITGSTESLFRFFDMSLAIAVKKIGSAVAEIPA